MKIVNFMGLFLLSSLCPNLIKPNDSHVQIVGNKWRLPASHFFLNDIEPSGNNFQKLKYCLL